MSSGKGLKQENRVFVFLNGGALKANKLFILTGLAAT